METYTYRCPDCGFVYQVPDYWVSYAPDDTMEFPHIRYDTGKSCETTTLQFVKSTEE